MLGYHHRVARVDLTRATVDYLEPTDAMLGDVLGGRGLGARLLRDHGPTVDPLAPESLFAMMAGPLTGTDFPLANRLAFVFRSPLTRTIAWAMTGGYVATELKRGGLDGLVVTGRAARPCYLAIGGTGVEICDASSLWGQGAVEAVSALQAAHGGAHALTIGPVGERLSPVATVCAFSSYAFTVGDYAEALTLVTGEPFTAEALMTAGDRIFALERQYNVANGFTERDDTLPARFTHEGVPDGIHAGTVCNLEPMLDEYYALRGWARDIGAREPVRT